MEFVSGKIRLKTIFQDHWEAFKNAHLGKLRDSILVNVFKMMTCNTMPSHLWELFWCNRHLFNLVPPLAYSLLKQKGCFFGKTSPSAFSKSPRPLSKPEIPSSPPSTSAFKSTPFHTLFSSQNFEFHKH